MENPVNETTATKPIVITEEQRLAGELELARSKMGNAVAAIRAGKALTAIEILEG